MPFRHEWKHILNYADYLSIRQRLRAALPCDAHATGGQYRIRSLYFDTPGDRALRDKLDGVSVREKFRIRYYNLDLSFIQLEKKSKVNSLCQKQAVPLTAQQAEAILHGDFGFLTCDSPPLVLEFYSKVKSQGLRPKIVVEYLREPFVYPPGNVRITIDHHLRQSHVTGDFLRENLVTIPAGTSPYLLEVKYDEFLPAFIWDIIQTGQRRPTAFSKYAACRMYG